MTTFYAGVAGMSFQTRGASYTADANGMIYNVPTGGFDPIDLMNEGCVPVVAPLDVNFRNLIDGGDFTVNPWQRNVAGLATAGVITTAITNTPTYFPDRWFGVGGASSAVQLSKVADTTIPGFAQSCKHQRQVANTNTAAISFGHVLESADSIRAQGRQITLSFWAKAGANYSGGALTAQVISGTGTDQSAANLVAGSWTGQANIINATQALGGLFTRFQFTGTVPVGATQLGVLFTWTPTGTAGSDDSVSFHGLQLEIGTVASPFEHRDVQVELEICQRYAWLLNEPASGVVVGSGMVSATNTEIWYLALPVQMRAAPTVTTSVGTFKSNSSTGGVVAATGLTGNATHTPTVIGLTATGTGTAGQAAMLQGGGGSGYVLASADY